MIIDSQYSFKKKKKREMIQMGGCNSHFWPIQYGRVQFVIYLFHMVGCKLFLHKMRVRI